MTEQQSNSIINALKRIERVGDRASKTNQKLRDAVNLVADKLIDILPPGLSVMCPSGGEVEVQTVTELSSYTGQEEDYVVLSYRDRVRVDDPNDEDGWSWASKYTDIRDADPGVCHRFANDIADGLLDRVTEVVDARLKECDELAESLVQNA